MNLGIFDLEIFGIYDKGVPNQERIVLRANNLVDLSNWALIIGFKGASNTIWPVRDFFLWLGKTLVQGNGWVFVYTGAGQPLVTQEVHTKDPIHVMYWHRPHVLFGDNQVTAALMRLDNLQIYERNSSMASLLAQPAQDLLTLARAAMSRPPKPNP